MEKHHKETIDNTVYLFKKEPYVKALILGGSIAHGFEKPDSDVDVYIVVDKDDFTRRKAENNLVYNNRDPDVITYEGGYIDGKYIDKDFLALVAEKGSDAIRYSFKDNTILFSRDKEIDALIEKITRFPKEKKAERIERFVAQVLAWKWYYSEAVKKQNQYLVYLAIQKIVLFSGRIILTENELFYPYHKWLIAELGKAVKVPDNFIDDIQKLLSAPNVEFVNEFCLRVIAFVGYDEQSYFWPNRFMCDSEQNWIEHEPPVDDL
jgi:predicted nucleotidyltransferase